MVVIGTNFRLCEFCDGARTHTKHVCARRVDIDANLSALDVDSAIGHLQTS
jgi:hypothetical protein